MRNARPDEWLGKLFNKTSHKYVIEIEGAWEAVNILFWKERNFVRLLE